MTEDKNFVAVFADGTCEAYNEKQAGELIDLADTHEPFSLFCNVRGTLFPVTTGELIRHDSPDSIYYGSSPLLANGMCVGYVSHSDH
jgi:hypothetical protein